MKTLFISIMVMGSAALACLPPPPGLPDFVMQRTELSQILSSDVVTEAINSRGLNVRVTAILPHAPYQIRLSDGCSIKVERNTDNAPVGTCYNLLPLKISDIKCKIKR